MPREPPVMRATLPSSERVTPDMIRRYRRIRDRSKPGDRITELSGEQLLPFRSPDGNNGPPASYGPPAPRLFFSPLIKRRRQFLPGDRMTLIPGRKTHGYP